MKKKSNDVKEGATYLLKIFNTFLSVIDRKVDQKYHKDVEDLTNILHLAFTGQW